MKIRFFFRRKNMKRVQMKRGKISALKSPEDWELGVSSYSESPFPHCHWLSLWPGTSNFFLSLSFSTSQNDTVGPHVTQALYGIWPSVTLSVLFIFIFFTVGERTICWLTKKQTITKVNPLLSLLKFFGRQLPPGTGLCILRTCHLPPQFQAGMALEFCDARFLNWRRAQWHWLFCLGLVVESLFKMSSWVVIQRWLLIGAKSFHKDVIKRSDFPYQRRKLAFWKS